MITYNEKVISKGSTATTHPRMNQHKRQSDRGKKTRIVIKEMHSLLQPELVGATFSSACQIMHKHELRTGFIIDEQAQNEIYLIPGPSPDQYWVAQVNPRRAIRPQAGSTPKCVLDLNEIKNVGHQRFFLCAIDESFYVVLNNPYPYMPQHATIAAKEHVPQTWRCANPEETIKTIRKILKHLWILAENDPNAIIIWNDLDAGASLFRHFHYQGFHLPPGHGPMPIQMVSSRTKEVASSHVIPIGFQDEYPVVAFRISGNLTDCINQGTKLIDKWIGIQGDAAAINLIAMTEGGQVCVYFVPRNRLYKRAPGFSGIPGCLEVAGSFVLSSDWQQQAIREGQIGYAFFCQILHSIRPPAALHYRAWE
jgi:hypothetical protein